MMLNFRIFNLWTRRLQSFNVIGIKWDQIGRIMWKQLTIKISLLIFFLFPPPPYNDTRAHEPDLNISIQKAHRSIWLFILILVDDHIVKQFLCSKGVNWWFRLRHLNLSKGTAAVTKIELKQNISLGILFNWGNLTFFFKE